MQHWCGFHARRTVTLERRIEMDQRRLLLLLLEQGVFHVQQTSGPQPSHLAEISGSPCFLNLVLRLCSLYLIIEMYVATFTRLCSAIFGTYTGHLQVQAYY